MAEIVQGRFDDFESLVETCRGWSLDLSKIDRGAFHGELFQLVTDDFILSRGRFSSHLRQKGSPPPGLRTMTVHVARDMSQYWRGRQVNGDDLMIFPLDGEIDTVSDPRFDIMTISFDQDGLLAQADDMGFSSIAKVLKKSEVLPFGPGRMGPLRKVLVQSIREPGNSTQDPAALQARVQGEVIRLLATGTGDSEAGARTSPRLRVFRDAQEYLVRHPGRQVEVGELSRAIGVSIRTLQYASHEHAGVGPKAYINALRLNATRKELRSSEPGRISVADVANHQGFWHMGQFAADYRKLFGENPSVTLAGTTEGDGS